MAFLEIKGISKHFGGLLANSDISFSIEQGKIVGLIGPNGAGKTTLYNCITGFLCPDSGTILFQGNNITGLPPYKISELGMGRTFQVVKTFQTMTVFENIIVGALSKHLHLTNAVRDAEEILEFTELTDKRSFIGSSLTVADRKRVELARALATGPKLLLLDEVMAGLNPTEIVMATNLIRKIRDTGVTILLVEHIMEVVMPLSEWVYVLDKGELIAEGIPKDVCCNKQVIKAYLGEQWDVENK